MTSTPNDVANSWEGIEMAARIAGAKYPQLVAAQWALESGWGRRESGQNNLFGLKGKGSVHTTQEQAGPGVKETIQASFIDFPSRRACVEYLVDRWYHDFKGYHGVNRAESAAAAATQLQQQGYATDEHYAKLLIKLMQERQQVKAANPVVAAPKPPALITIGGMAGPAKRPHDFGFKAGDSHLIMNDRQETMVAWSFEGQQLWRIPAIARGQGADTEWKRAGTDTPPGIYKLGQLYDDVARVGLRPAYQKVLMQYGWQFYDMVELENQEARYGRSGVGLHGGGTACGWPGAWAPKQDLVSTLGCIRIHNIDLRDKIQPLHKRGTVFVSVFQEIA